MFKKFIYPLLMLFACKEVKEKPSTLTTMNTLPAFSISTIDGKPLDLKSFKGKKLLLVNVASECGYTPQYKQLQELYNLKKDQLEIIAFPANNFGGQEPGTNGEIAAFCSKNYGVTFTVCEKISVAGNDQHPLYQWLSNSKENGWNDQAPTWNFCKYLLDEEGKLIQFYNSAVNPLDEELLSKL
jgi:glutathione peroxidase